MTRSIAVRPRLSTGLALALALAAGPAAAYEGYHRLAEVESALRDWAAKHPRSMTLETIGTSAGGHDLLVARVAAEGPVPPDERPGVFVGANVAGPHNAGTEAALGLLRSLLEDAGGETAELFARRTFYVAPVLNPDAHDGLFAAVRVKRGGNAQTLDHDRDGFTGEDGYDDLDGDGRITELRIPDPAGPFLPHPEEPRLMVRQDAKKKWAGAYRVESEGRDDDGDGAFNEDPEDGIVPDFDFPHAFPFPDRPEAGPWPGYAPEVKALFDFFLARRNIALAVVYGPANNFLALPESLGGGGDLGSQTFKVPSQAAEFLGLDPEEEYTIDEVWDAAKDLPFVRQGNVTKDQLAQFLGAGAATRLEDDDRKLLEGLAKDYEKRLEEAGLDKERPAAQYAGGGLTPWLYFQYGALALELDVWGIPKPAKEKKEDGEEKKLTVEGLADLSAEEFLELGEEKIAAFLKEAGAPAQFTAAMVIERVEGGQITPAAMAKLIASRGGGGGDGDDKDDPETRRRRDVLAWLEANHPDAIRPWTEVTLPDGTRAETGGVDPFAETTPPAAKDLEAAIRVHTETVLDLAGRLAFLEIASLDSEDLGGGVYRVEAVARNTGELPTHTKMASRARSRLPVRLEIETGNGVELVTGRRAVTSERLEGSTGTIRGEWLVQAAPGAAIRVRVRSESAGSAERTHTLAQGGRR